MTLALDRKSFNDIFAGGQGNIGGAMLPPPEGVWGLPPEMVRVLLGYDPDVLKSRAEARKLMEKLGYSPIGSSMSKSERAMSPFCAIRQ